MEVVAVSRSIPKELDLGFMKMKTSLIHEPLTSPADYIEIDATGVVGNKPAVHDGPVYIFFAEHYDYWCSELGVDRAAWDWCHWAENITVRYKTGTGMAEPRFETEMHLGEVWRVGPDVRLELCGARIPCQKVSWRCGQKDSWLRPLAESGRVGVYMRVLRGGRVHPGNEVVVESLPLLPLPLPPSSSLGAAADDEEQQQQQQQQEQQPSVAMISRIAFDASLKTSDTLDLLANHALLLPMNKKFLAAKKVAIEDRRNTGKNAWKGWRDLRVARVVQELGDVKSFYLEPADGAPLANYLPGQFLSVRVPSSASTASSSSRGNRHDDVRSWTISNYATRDGPTYYRLTIKRNNQPPSSSSSTSTSPGAAAAAAASVPTPPPTTSSSASAWMHDHATEGTVLAARSPAGRFVLDWTKPVALRPVYVSAGIGLTPVAAMLEAHALHPKFARTPALWVHVARSAGDLALWRDAGLALLLRRRAVPLERHVFLTGGLGDDEEEAEEEEQMYRASRPADRETLKAILGSSSKWNVLGAGEIDVPAKMSTFYVCGPTAFEATVKACLAEVGIPAANIRSESFSAVNNSGQGDLATAQVRFAKSGRTATWSRDKPVSLLELAESLGLAPDYGCRGGAVAGVGVQANGTVLTCSVTPASDVVELEI
ncbi:globin domain-containing protein [Apiospora phragmitis]|uniref:Globin domain-containing protein n=1 Tax=Apiospora phragmitis TaxID=2905665 RepID=A0ABR1WSE7_9PEZI